MNKQTLNELLVLLACEECKQHDLPDNYLESYPEWNEQLDTLKIIIWRFKLRK